MYAEWISEKAAILDPRNGGQDLRAKSSVC